MEGEEKTEVEENVGRATENISTNKSQLSCDSPVWPTCVTREGGGGDTRTINKRFFFFKLCI